MSLANRMLAHSIDHCTESAGHRRRRKSSWAKSGPFIAALCICVAYVIFK